MATGILASLIEWTQSTFGSYGSAGIFVVAFMESSFFPIPPDLLLIPFIIATPDLWIFYAAVATVGSVAGAVLGYYIGLWGGRPLLLKLAGEHKTHKVDRYFKKYGDWAIGIAGFTPIPYKKFT